MKNVTLKTYSDNVSIFYDGCYYNFTFSGDDYAEAFDRESIQAVIDDKLEEVKEWFVNAGANAEEIQEALLALESWMTNSGVVDDDRWDIVSDGDTTATLLQEHGIMLDSAPKYSSELYRYGVKEYVVLCENTVITREQDNENGPEEAIFPY